MGVGVQSMAESRVGGTMINGVRYYLDALKSGQADEASRIVDAAIQDNAVRRGRLGANRTAQKVPALFP